MSWSSIPYAIKAILGERKRRDEIRDKAMKKLRASTTGDRMMSDLSELAERIDAFLESYKDSDNYEERLLGPFPYLTPPPFFAFRAKRKEYQINERLLNFGLPEISEEVRTRFYSQWQDFDEDAGGFFRRRWVVAFGASRGDYQAMLKETER